VDDRLLNVLPQVDGRLKPLQAALDSQGTEVRARAAAAAEDLEDLSRRLEAREEAQVAALEAKEEAHIAAMEAVQEAMAGRVGRLEELVCRRTRAAARAAPHRALAAHNR
jgi:hypothetical protein